MNKLLVFILLFYTSMAGGQIPAIGGMLLPNQVEEIPIVELNSLNSTAFCSITASAEVSGNNISERGIVVSTLPNPTVSDYKVVRGSGSGFFTATADGRTYSTLYYVRAYAITSIGETYSNELSVTTLSRPTASTGQAYNIGETTASIDASIIKNGNTTDGINLTWGIQGGTYSTGTKYTTGTSETWNLTGLANNTQYYYYARASTDCGDGPISDTKYFTTTSLVPPTYASSTTSIDVTEYCPMSNGYVLGLMSSSVELFSDNYSGAVPANIEISAVNYDYDGDGYSGYTLRQNNWGGTIITPPYTTAVLNQVNYPTTPFLGIQYNVSSSSDLCEKPEGDQIQLTYRIQDEHGQWGPYRTFTATLYSACYQFGYMYNSYAANNPLISSSTNWIVPETSHFNTLANYLGGTTVAGGKLKESGFLHWLSPNTGATNSSGLSAKAGGLRYYLGGFSGLKNTAWMWTTTYSSTSGGLDYYQVARLFYNNDDISIGSVNGGRGNSGMSVMLVNPNTSLSNGQSGTYTGNDGKVYPTICIGSQEWVGPLRETKLRGGATIPLISDQTLWDADRSGARCAYGNNLNYVDACQ